ncbi:MAG: glycosyltransferase family 4 protein [Bacteroidales bacterium]|nr:glycosyltransferase family 4 protein [Bacteroidales bacterium]
MRVLMFGWEFPPHITGGLGTACYGLTKGLSRYKDVDVTFVVPKAYGDEDQSSARIIGADGVHIKERTFTFSDFLRKMKMIEVESLLVPYLTPEEFEKSFETLSEKEIGVSLQTRVRGRLRFTGTYGKNLFQEISNYALVATVLAHEHHFDIIHAHDWLTFPAALAAKAVSGKPLVVHVHATDFDRSGGSVNPSVYEIERKGMEGADKVITVSNLTRETVIQKYGIPPEKVVTIYNAVDPLTEEERAREKKGIQEKIVTFLGRITLQKGPEYFIEAANKVLQRMDNVRFVMAGSGDMLHRMIRRAARLRIVDRFHFTGFLRGDDVQKMFSLSDVYVMPSVSEPFGISPLEAMQSSVPVIISYQSGVSEVLKYAIKVNFWDVDAMADAIYGILNYDALSDFFKKYGKEEVLQMKWENSAGKLREVYKSLCR